MTENTTFTYMDYNATTPVCQEVITAIKIALQDYWGNPSSSHCLGQHARSLVEYARQQCAEMIDGSADEIIFTSGGTESNHMVLQTFLQSQTLKQATPHIITSAIEHDSIIKPLQKWADAGLIDVTFVKPNSHSHRVEPDDIIDAITPHTVLVSIMLANNETGVIQPVRLISDAIHDYSKKHSQHICIHSDAAQAIGKISVNVNELSVDYLTIVGHKFYGPRIGALFVRGHRGKCASPLHPVFNGGGQEHGFRSGTENTAMIAGLGKASELVSQNIGSYESAMRHIRDYLEKQLLKAFGSLLIINGKNSQRLPNTCNMSIMCGEFSGSQLLSQCKRVIAGVGAACHSGHSNNGSAVLLASGISIECAKKAVRLSIGRETTTKDIDIAILDIKQAIESFKS